MPDNTPDLLDSTNTPAQGDPLADLVGDGKKFKDAAALAKGKLEADAFIEQLKSENAELRKLAGKQEQTTDQSKQIETLIERIEKLSGQNGNQSANLSKEEIAKLVKDGITTDRTEMNRKGNRAVVNAELVNSFSGDAAKASTHLKERMSQLGMTGDAAKELAETNPKVFRELFVPQKQAAPRQEEKLPAGRTQVDLNSQEERGASYYRNLRKELGSKYFDPQIQQARMKDAMRLGERFNQL